MDSGQDFWVYIIKCADGSYYTGCTYDLHQRFKAHEEGRAAEYTARRRPLDLVYSENHQVMGAARRREQQIKRWTKEKKEALINGNLAALKTLGKKTRSVKP